LRVAPSLHLSHEQEAELEACLRRPTLPVRVNTRVRVVLLAGCGYNDKMIAQLLDITRYTARLWRSRFLEEGLVGLFHDAPGRGRPRTVRVAETIHKVVTKTLQEKPRNATHWSLSRMAQETGIGETSIRTIWHDHGLKPHLLKNFKLSKDPHFEEKL